MGGARWTWSEAAGVAACLAAACGGPEVPEPPTVPVQDGHTSDTATAPATVPLAFTQPPRVLPNPVPRAPLVQILEVHTTEPTTLEVTTWRGAHTETRHFEPLSADHEVPLLGLGPSADFGVRVTAHGAAGSITSDDLSGRTPPLPDGFPTFDVELARPELMEPGYTLVPGGLTEHYVAALDPAGRVAWYYRTTSFIDEVHRTPTGLRLLVEDRDATSRLFGRVTEIDMRGRVLRSWAPAERAVNDIIPLPPEIGVLHHDVHPAPDDGWFSLTVEPVVEPQYPMSALDPLAPTTEATLVADVVVEVGPTGDLRRSWHLADTIDTRRIGHDSQRKGWWFDYFGPTTRDWSHANSVFYDAENDGILVSVRNQDALVYYDRQSLEALWILAPPGNWSPELDALRLQPVDPEFRWFWHQHSPQLLGDGRMMLFDNGNHARPAYQTPLPAPLALTRILELGYDPAAGTVELLWSYERRRNPRLYSPQRGDADMLPQTGNVLITYGDIWRPADDVEMRVVEVTHTDPAEVVWELAVRGSSGAVRCERVPSLYP